MPEARTRAEAAEEQPARFSYLGRPSTAARIHLLRRGRRERVTRALQGLAMCWGLAILSVLVPLLHFVLVPGFLVVGPLLLFQRLGEHATILDASGDCPGCGNHQTFAIGQAPAASMPLRCESCGRRIHLEPAPEALEKP